MTHTAEDVARQFFSVPSQPDEGVLLAFSTRAPRERVYLIDAMASHVQVSRNEMTNQLLSAGIHAVLEHLPDELRESIELGVVDRLDHESQAEPEVE